jgi:hypothetical protein
MLLKALGNDEYLNCPIRPAENFEITRNGFKTSDQAQGQGVNR